MLKSQASGFDVHSHAVVNVGRPRVERYDKQKRSGAAMPRTRSTHTPEQSHVSRVKTRLQDAAHDALRHMHLLGSPHLSPPRSEATYTVHQAPQSVVYPLPYHDPYEALKCRIESLWEELDAPWLLRKRIRDAHFVKGAPGDYHVLNVELARLMQERGMSEVVMQGLQGRDAVIASLRALAERYRLWGVAESASSRARQHLQASQSFELLIAELKDLVGQLRISTQAMVHGVLAWRHASGRRAFKYRAQNVLLRAVYDLDERVFRNAPLLYLLGVEARYNPLLVKGMPVVQAPPQQRARRLSASDMRRVHPMPSGQWDPAEVLVTQYGELKLANAHISAEVHRVVVTAQICARAFLKRSRKRRRTKALLLLQRNGRGHVDRRRVGLALGSAAAARIQAAYRGRCVRVQRQHQHNGASLIKAAWRGLCTRRTLSQWHRAAFAVQCTFRRHLCRRHLHVARIQAAGRACLLRRSLLVKLHIRTAAQCVQKAGRALAIRHTLREMHIMAAVATLRATAAGFKARRVMVQRHMAATCLRSMVAGAISRSHVAHQRRGLREGAKVVLHGLKALRYRGALNVRLALRRRRHDAAKQIQACWRQGALRQHEGSLLLTWRALRAQGNLSTQHLRSRCAAEGECLREYGELWCTLHRMLAWEEEMRTPSPIRVRVHPKPAEEQRRAEYIEERLPESPKQVAVLPPPPPLTQSDAVLGEVCGDERTVVHAEAHTVATVHDNADNTPSRPLSTKAASFHENVQLVSVPQELWLRPASPTVEAAASPARCRAGTAPQLIEAVQQEALEVLVPRVEVAPPVSPESPPQENVEVLYACEPRVEEGRVVSVHKVVSTPELVSLVPATVLAELPAHATMTTMNTSYDSAQERTVQRTRSEPQLLPYTETTSLLLDVKEEMPLALQVVSAGSRFEPQLLPVKGKGGSVGVHTPQAAMLCEAHSSDVQLMPFQSAQTLVECVVHEPVMVHEPVVIHEPFVTMHKPAPSESVVVLGSQSPSYEDERVYACDEQAATPSSHSSFTVLKLLGKPDAAALKIQLAWREYCRSTRYAVQLEAVPCTHALVFPSREVDWHGLLERSTKALAWRFFDLLLTRHRGRVLACTYVAAAVALGGAAAREAAWQRRARRQDRVVSALLHTSTTCMLRHRFHTWRLMWLQHAVSTSSIAAASTILVATLCNQSRLHSSSLSLRRRTQQTLLCKYFDTLACWGKRRAHRRAMQAAALGLAGKTGKLTLLLYFRKWGRRQHLEKSQLAAAVHIQRMIRAFISRRRARRLRMLRRWVRFFLGRKLAKAIAARTIYGTWLTRTMQANARQAWEEECRATAPRWWLKGTGTTRPTDIPSTDCHHTARARELYRRKQGGDAARNAALTCITTSLSRSVRAIRIRKAAFAACLATLVLSSNTLTHRTRLSEDLSSCTASTLRRRYFKRLRSWRAHRTLLQRSDLRLLRQAYSMLFDNNVRFMPATQTQTQNAHFFDGFEDNVVECEVQGEHMPRYVSSLPLPETPLCGAQEAWLSDEEEEEETGNSFIPNETVGELLHYKAPAATTASIERHVAPHLDVPVAMPNITVHPPSPLGQCRSAHPTSSSSSRSSLYHLKPPRCSDY